jgi:O-antigen/teichoic acid export membrane protein
MKNGFAKNTLYSMAGFGILVISNFVFNALTARWLGASNYGIFTSFFYLLLGFSQPNNSLQLATAKYSALENKSLPETLSKVSSTLWLFALVLFSFFAAISPFLKELFNLPSVFDVFIGGGVVAFWLVLAGFRGVYQGKLNFFAYGLNMGLEGLIRAALGIGLILLGFGIRGAFGASILGSSIAILLLFFSFSGFRFKKISFFKIEKKIAVEFIKGCAILLPFGIITGLDLTMVQTIIKGAESGYISTCGIYGKNFITISLLFANLVYTYALKHREKTLWIGIGLSSLLFIMATIFSLFFGDWLILLIQGQDFLPAGQFLPLYILASLPLGIMQNLISFAIAKEIKAASLFVWIALICLAIIYYFTLKSLPIETFLWIMMLSTALMDIILLIIIKSFRPPKGRLSIN